MKTRKLPKSATKNTGSTKSSVGANAKAPVEIPIRWRTHYAALAELRERLLGECHEELAAAAEPIESGNLHQADSATDEFDRDLALGLLLARQDALYEIDAALARIREGSYGICEVSGRPIPAARLRAVPWTRYTEEVGEELESSGQTDYNRRLGPLISIQGEASHQLAPSGQITDAMGGTYAPETPTRELAELPAEEGREEPPATGRD
jgi:RNA polymerase-binding transcription factor DksA